MLILGTHYTSKDSALPSSLPMCSWRYIAVHYSIKDTTMQKFLLHYWSSTAKSILREVVSTLVKQISFMPSV